jgi:hypothetical protein
MYTVPAVSFSQVVVVFGKEMKIRQEHCILPLNKDLLRKSQAGPESFSSWKG